MRARHLAEFLRRHFRLSQFYDRLTAVRLFAHPFGVGRTEIGNGTTTAGRRGHKYNDLAACKLLKWQEVLIHPGISRIAVEPLRPFVPIEIVQILALVAAARRRPPGRACGPTTSPSTNLIQHLVQPTGVRDVFGAKRDKFFADEVIRPS